MPFAIHHRARAFTLMETTVAGAIVAVLLTALFVLNSDMLHLLRSSAETTNASTHLQTRVEQVRLANWTQLVDPVWVQANLLSTPTDADFNLPGISETFTAAPYVSPCSTAPLTAPPPGFTVSRQADGTTSISPAGYASTTLLSQQEMLRIDLTITWPSLNRTRTRTQTTLVSPWGISK